MVYKPKIKNLPELINDLRSLAEGKVSPTVLTEKMSTRDYHYDCTDGFEDILDSIYPFMKQLMRVQNVGSDRLAIEKVNTLVELLVQERSLSDLEKVRIS